MHNASARPVRILIADDHCIFSSGLRCLLETERSFTVVAEAQDGDQAVELALDKRPDIALIDLAMPRMLGLHALRELAGRVPNARVILLTAAITRPQIVEGLRLGARGVVLKEAATEMLFRSIRAVMAGQYWIGRENVTDLVAYLHSRPSRANHGSQRGLTSRERQIVAAVIDGLANKQIAERYQLSDDTVKHHLSHIFDKVGVSTRLELALFAMKHGLLNDLPASR